MTKEEIINTPKLVDFMLDESVIADSREKLRKRLEEVCNLATKALEQEPRKGHWVPVSKKLPKEHICDDGYHEPSDSVLVQMKSGAMDTASYWSRYDEKWLGLVYPTTDEVVAWMLLPEPYKANTEEEE